jgi:hypothetical protein
MKKLYIIAALAVATLTANAQESLTLSTYNGTNVEKYDGKICNVTVNRYVFTGWNTIALPFDIAAEELNEVFGSDCKLERLVSVENVGSAIQLNFQDCKAQGMTANTPYILYYTGESMNKKIAKEATISYSEPAVSFKTRMGETVTMAGVQQMTKGIGFYGILARDNAEAKWAKVDGSLSGFLATRCCIQLSSATAERLITNHIGASEVSTISAIAHGNELVDVYNVNGQKVAAQVSAAQVNGMQPGIYVVKGQKVLVK